MRDDKSYPYIALSQQHKFPRMVAVRLKKKPTRGVYFGPYPNATAVRDTLNLIQKIFKIRNCSDVYFNARSRPCLQYQIKRCTAPCTAYISQEKYQLAVHSAVQFLKGKSQKIIDELSVLMDKAAAELAFEEAALLRNQIKQLRIVQEQQGISRIRGDADIIAIEIESGVACIQCVTVRAGEVVANASFFPSLPKVLGAGKDDDLQGLWQQIFTAFISHYYIDTPERIPKLLVTKHVIEEKAALQTMLTELRGRKCIIQTSPREINAQWYDFAFNNARLAISSRLLSADLVKKRYNALNDLLAYSTPIERMECFDISHMQGDSTVASCVVFDPSGPNKKAYRRFNINGITPGDDYAAMEQAITRRAKYWVASKKFPDLLIIDGGRGQVAVAQRVFALLDLRQTKIIGIAKGVHRKVGMERLIFADETREITLPPDSEALHLLQHIRDESHRFAITAHRKKRQKSGLSSSLETIEGLGPKRRQALLTRFGGMRELAKAPVAEIIKVAGISKTLAMKIHQHFQ